MPEEAIVPEELTERILRVIADAQRVPIENVTIGKTFEELGIDSMDGVSLLFALESEFDINIPDDAARNIRSVREMVEGVAKLIAQKDASGQLSVESSAPNMSTQAH